MVQINYTAGGAAFIRFRIRLLFDQNVARTNVSMKNTPLVKILVPYKHSQPRRVTIIRTYRGWHPEEL